MTVFAFDTSALLRDHTIIDMVDLSQDRIVITKTVLDELDSGKSIPGDAGWNARQAIKAIHGLLRSQNDAVCFAGVVAPTCTSSKSDTQILEDCASASLRLRTIDNHTDRLVLVTEDLGMIVAAETDPYRNSISAMTIVEAFPSKAKSNTILTINTTDEGVDSIHSNEVLAASDLDPDIVDVLTHLPVWHSVLVKSPGRSALAVWDGSGLIRVLSEDGSGASRPLGVEQKFARWALRQKNIPLVCITGPAGTGKSFLTYAEALDMAFAGKTKKVVFVKNFQEVGRGLGFLPGELKDKLAPWMDSMRDTVSAIYGSKSKAMFDSLTAKEAIEIVPMSYIRGRTFNDCFVVFDEAQNTTPHEIKTVVTRAGKNTKVVVLGDTHQIDLPRHGTNSCGLSHAIRRMAKSRFVMHCHLSETHRSDLAQDAADLL